MSRRAARPLTGRERAIIEDLAQFRILRGDQIQSVHFAGGTLIGARRRTQACLKRLVDESHLIRFDRRVGGERAGSASYCYALGPAGQRLLDPVRRSRRPAEPGLAFVRHHLAVADVWVGLVQAERDGDLEQLIVEAEPACWRNVPKGMGASEWLKPDLFVLLSSGDYDWSSFVEVDLATESLVRIERTCRRYLTYCRSGHEQATAEVFPRVVWLTVSDRRVHAIRQVVERLPPADRALFTVGLLNQSPHILKGGES